MPLPTVADEEIDELFFRLIARFKAHVRRCADTLGLSVLQLIALRHLDDPVPMGQLAEVLFSDPSVMTAVADGLERQGYIRRQGSKTDRRVKELVLTPEGREIKSQVHELVTRDNPVFATLNDEERLHFAALLRMMTAAEP